MREWRRQADPSFPVAVKSRPSKPPPSRPSEPPPARPTEPPAPRNMEPPVVPSDPLSSRLPEGVLKGHKGRKKRKNKKDLRVSFDLENTQERVVPEEGEEEAVVECWEDLSDGDMLGPPGCDNSYSDGDDSSFNVGGGEERLSETPDSLEGLTYFGISHLGDDKEVDDENTDLQEDSPREVVTALNHGGVVTYVHGRGMVTDLDVIKEASDTSLDPEVTDVRYPEELTVLSLLEGFTDMSHSNQVSEVSHIEALTDVSQPDVLNDVSFESLDVSRDENSCTEGVTDVKNQEQLTKIPHFVEQNHEIGNIELPTDARNSEEVNDTSQFEALTHINHLEGLTDVTFPEELTGVSHFEDVTHQNHPEEFTSPFHLEEVTDMSHLEELTDSSQSERVSDESHLEEPTEVTYPGGINDINLHSVGVSHGELTNVSQPEELTTVTSEELFSGSGSEGMTDINPDNLTAVSPDTVTDGTVHTGQPENVLFVVSDTKISDGESLGETLGTGREESTPSPSFRVEADSYTGPATGLTCWEETQLSAPPPASETEEDKQKGDLEDDDDEWETETDSQETSENTWEAAETIDKASAGQRPTGDGGEDSDSLIPNDDIEAVLLALIEDQEKVVPPPPHVSQTQAQEEDHMLASAANLGEEGKDSERETSPQVTIGFECRDRKSTSVYASETESEGELVPCEDKCVGTADLSDEDLDLSSRDNVPHEEGVSQNTVNECQEWDLSLDTSKQYTLAAPELQVGGSSPSPEIPEIPEEGKCMGNSESGKEKDKINGKKIGKKKGKKNKREAKVESVVVPADVIERPKLVRGRAWKGKQDKISVQRAALLNLSFGKEFCESEAVEGTSNLLTETYTETTLLTPTRCPLGATVFTETPCTACSSVSGEFSEPDNLHDEWKCGDQQLENSGLVALVAEVKTCEEAPKPAPGPVSTLSPPTVTVQVTGASDEEDYLTYDVSSPTEDTNEFFIVKTQTVASPSQVLTEYVEDTESEDDVKLQDEKIDCKTELSSQLFAATTCTSAHTNENSPNMTVQNENSIYIDADDSGCTDALNEPFDYKQSFPQVLGTQQLNLMYTYDSGSDSDSESGQGSIEGGGQTPDSKGSNMKTNVEEFGDGDRTYTSGWGEIIYEGPCLCADIEDTRERQNPLAGLGNVSGAGGSGAEEQLCVPAVRVSDFADIVAGDDNEAREEATGSELPPDIMGSNQEDQGSEDVANAKDIRLRINQIVGARLLRDRGHVVGPDVIQDSETREEQPGGHEDSPLPGSSPASSSGVQGSDEMSLSRSRSRSPSREESLSPACTTSSVPESPVEPRPGHLLQQDRYEREALESLRALRFEGNIESTPEKTVPLDCSFRTFKDMYQINPIYLTDSDDHDELNESDTVVPVSTTLDYDPERSITVTSKCGRVLGWEFLQYCYIPHETICVPSV